MVIKREGFHLDKIAWPQLQRNSFFVTRFVFDQNNKETNLVSWLCPARVDKKIEETFINKKCWLSMTSVAWWLVGPHDDVDWRII